MKEQKQKRKGHRSRRVAGETEPDREARAKNKGISEGTMTIFTAG